jgi:hypothetical protein
MKIILGALTAVTLLVGVTASQPAMAQERCWNNGYGWHCVHHHGWWRHHHPYWGWNRY